MVKVLVWERKHDTSTKSINFSLIIAMKLHDGVCMESV